MGIKMGINNNNKQQSFYSVDKSLKKEDKSLKKIVKHRSASVIAGLSISLLTFTSVEALNIGKAKSQSYIGQPLSIFVPVSDSAEIIDLNKLIVSKPSSSQLGELNVSQQDNGLVYKVVSKGPEKGILITTVEPFNEPYIDVGVKVDYKGVTQLRKLTALIDLQPLAGESPIGNALITQENSSSSEIVESTPTNISVTNSITNSANSNASSRTYSNEIMGPYDWAQAGAIPEKFGPVLDGQSLWRVARRINESMNVSIDQMMWALFRANPQAFSTQNVSSLQAGSILNIPEESFVREVTELGAVRLLSAQTEATNTLIATESDSVVETPVESVSEEVSTDDSVVISETAETSNNNVVSFSELSAVDELKNEVSSLNQQLEAQEERIRILEERLAVYESSNNTLANSNAVDVLTTDSSSQVVETEIAPIDGEAAIQSEEPVVESPVVSEETISSAPIEQVTQEVSQVVETEIAPIDGEAAIQSEEPVVESPVVSEETISSAPIEQVTQEVSQVVETEIAPIDGEAAIESEDPVVEDPVVNEETIISAPTEQVSQEASVQEEQLSQEEPSALTAIQEAITGKLSWLTLALGALAVFLLGLLYVARNRFIPAILKLFGGGYEYDETESLLSSVSKKRMPIRDLEHLRQEEVMAERSNQANAQDQGFADEVVAKGDFEEDFEDYSFFVDDEELMDVEELSFPDRIKQLIESGDYEEAKKTLNFATAANVDDHEINVSMLKIFAAEADQESFDKLFERVHANIEEYDAESQLLIAELQSEMAIGKVINFDSDQMAS